MTGFLARLGRSPRPQRVIVREYGRDSLLVWTNVLLAPLLAALGLRVGLRSEEQIAERMAEDAAAMRQKGFIATSTETFSLPTLGGRDASAHWYRVTYEATPTDARGPDQPG